MARLAIVVWLAVAAVGCGWGPPYAVTPLAAASRSGDLAAIDRLLAAGADINQGSGVNDWPPVIHAIHTHQLAALEHLLERGAAVDDRLRARALNVARGSGDEAAVQPILDAHRRLSTAAR
jgi:ankyrin repeat protein